MVYIAPLVHSATHHFADVLFINLGCFITSILITRVFIASIAILTIVNGVYKPTDRGPRGA
jgi:hypothetical protein